MLHIMGRDKLAVHVFLCDKPFPLLPKKIAQSYSNVLYMITFMITHLLASAL